MKSNFKPATIDTSKINTSEIDVENKELTKEEFEKFIIHSGAKGSFMVYRTEKKEEELGIDEL